MSSLNLIVEHNPSGGSVINKLQHVADAAPSVQTQSGVVVKVDTRGVRRNLLRANEKLLTSS